MKKEKSKKETPAESSYKKKDIAGIFLLAFGLILLAAFIVDGDKKYVGAIGAVISGKIGLLLGYIKFVVPAILFWWSFTELRHRKFTFKYSMSLGMLMMVLGGCILIHIISPGNGGVIGDFTSDVIIQITFGRIGAYIISLALIFSSIILMADISPKAIYFKVSDKIKIAKENLAKKKQEALKLKAIKAQEQKVTEPKPIKPLINIKKQKKEKSKLKKDKEKIKKVKETKMQDSEEKSAKTNKTTVDSKNSYSLDSSVLTVPPQTESFEEAEIERGEKLKEALANFNIPVEIAGIKIGPAITRYEVTVPADVKLSRIRNLDSNIAMALEAKTVRLLTPIPGMAAVGVEVPAIKQETVFMKTLIDSKEFTKSIDLPYCLGKAVNGDLIVADLAKMPHLLLAGATGSGKSVAIHVLINSLIYKLTPEEVRLVLIDPKRVELPAYAGIPHLYADVITDSSKAVKMLQFITREMDNRYDKLAKIGVADIKSYNDRSEELGHEKMPRLVVVIDELADLMVLAKDKVETAIVRIAQLARAVGIHLVLATQRPSVDVITGIIKANLPARIAFNVLSGVDSRTILDSNGAEKLLGKGDMLFLSSELPQPERLQGVFITRPEVDATVNHLKEKGLEYDILLDLEEGLKESMAGRSSDTDEMYEEAVQLVMRSGKASISLLQRRLKIGYNRAARIVDMMEDNQIIGPDNGSKGREILVSSHDYNS